jgi:alpha-2-macroglobulin
MLDPTLSPKPHRFAVLMKKIWALLKIILKAPFLLLGKIVGSVSYSPPLWTKKIRIKSERLERGILRSREWSRKNRPLVYGAVGVLALALISWLSWYGYKNWIPHPDWATVAVDSPNPMNLRVQDPKPDPVKFRFSQSVADISKVGIELKEGVSLSPEVAGRWFWENDRTLSFFPEKEWPVGKTFDATFSKSLMGRKVILESYSVSFSSQPFQVSLSSSEFFQHPTLPKEKKGVVSVRFNYPVDPESFSKRVEAQLVDSKKSTKEVKFSIQYGPQLLDAYIHSDFLPIPKYDSVLNIEVEKGIRSSLGGDGSENGIKVGIPVPGMFNYFKISTLTAQVVRNEAFEPEHVFIVTTSTGARSEDLAKNFKVYLLPEQNPALQSHVAIDHWASAGEVSAPVQKLMKPIPVETVPSEFENSTVHSFRFKAPVGRYAYLKIEKGLKSFGDYVLAGDFEQVLKIPKFPKEVIIMHHGSILSLKGDRKIPILSRNISGIQFSARRMRPTDLHHFISQSSGRFQSPSFVNQWSFSEDNLAETFTEERIVQVDDPGKTQYHNFDFSKYLNNGTSGAKGIFFFSATEWDATNKRTIGQPSKRFIVVTDLGVVVKESVSQDLQVFVQSFSGGGPVNGARVEVLAKNGTTLFSENTDAVGRATFPALNGFKNEKEPVAVTVKTGDDYTFLPLGNSDRVLNMARFDISGVESTSESDRILSYVFTDRGIYRPGDTARFGVVTKALSWKPLPEGMPLEFVVVDPRGTELLKQRFSVKKDGFEEFSYTSSEESPTGSYQAQVHMIRNDARSEMLGSVNFKIEEFLPDRMKILVTLSKQSERGWVQAEELKAKVLLTNLFGTPAQSRKISSEFRLTPGFPSTREFSDYIFLDAKRAEKSYTEKGDDTETDEKGEAEVDLDLRKFDRASYRLEFIAEGFEAEGGRSVSTSSSVYISPLDYVVGYKADGDLSYLRMNVPRKVQLIALNPEMKKIAVKGLKSQIIEYRYVSVLMQQDNGTYKYQSVRKEIPLGDAKDVTIGEKGLEWTLDTSKGGSYGIVLKDNSGLEFAKIGYSVIAPSGLSRGLDRNAELQLSLNKTDYDKGDEIEVQIRAPYVGAGLITIEREKVFASQWFKTNSETSVQKIRIPQNIEGNAYVSVAFLRSLDSKEIYTSPLSYAVSPFTISKDTRKTNITLKVPEIARPGEKMKIRFSASRPTSMVLYGVDEGILQVASYKLPDPLSFFFTKRSLQVKTLQILDLLLPEFSVFQSLSSAGGDEEGALAANLNPFKRRRDKPVAFWSGIIDADSKEREYDYLVPDYFNGSLKVMAVAASASAVGNQSNNALVRGDFVLSPNVPLFVAPGDEFEVSVGISNTSVGSGEAKAVNLSLETSEHLEILGESKRVLDIKEGSEKSEKFKIRAKNVLGSGSFKFRIDWNGKKTKAEVDLSVRPPLPYMTDLRMGLVKSSNLKMDIERKMYPHFRKLNVSASILPLSLADGLMAYLDEYPYGCTEQIISKGFPALMLGNRADFKVSPDLLAKNFEAVMRTLRLRQTPQGGFGLWSATQETFDFPSLYAIHYLTEAKEKGLFAGNDLLQRGVGYLQSGALDRADTLHTARLWAYSLYLRARNSVIPTQSLETLRGILDAKFKNDWKADLTGVYLAGTYALLQKPEEGLKLVKAYKSSIKGLFDWNFFYDKSIRESQYLYILGKHFPDQIKDLSPEDLVAMLEPLMNGGYTTINSSYAVLGLDAYAKASQESGESTIKNVKILEKWKGGENELVLPTGLFPKVAFSDKAQELQIQNPNSAKVFYQTTEAGFDVALPKKEIQAGIEIQRSYLSDSDSEQSKIENGKELWVRLRARTLEGRHRVNNVAVVDLLPGGFEVVLDSIRKPQVQDARPTFEAPVDESYEGGESEGYHGEGEGEGEGESETEAGGDSESEGASMKVFERILNAISPTAFAQDLSSRAPASRSSTFETRSVDVREDRVIVFTDLTESMTEYFYKIKATNVGSFVVPPAFAESMYDKNVKSRGMPSKITVEP